MSEERASKRSRRDGELLVRGWKKYPRTSSSGDCYRSYPGQQARERSKAYEFPYSELNVMQRAAARDVLGIIHSESWELAMPRRLYSHAVSNVLVFQTKTWNNLTPREQDLATKHLGLSETVWNNKLALFQDELWRIKDVTLTDKEFEAVLGTLQKMSRHPFTKGDLMRFLLSLGRVLTPSQGVLIADTLKAGQCWETLLESTRTGINQYNVRVHVNLVIAAFLTDPVRFVNYSPLNLLPYWDDDSSGCVWGNASARAPDSAGPLLQPYAVALKERHDRRHAVRLLAGPFLVGTLPKTKVRHQPCLPENLALSILDEWVGDEPIDPHQVRWLYGYGEPLTSVL